MSLIPSPADQQPSAYQCLIQGDYSRAISLYEQAVQLEPEIRLHVWYLGLALLLQGHEEDAQAVWLMAMVEGEPEQVELWKIELVEVLQAEADRRELIIDYPVALLIRQNIHNIISDDVNNLFKIIEHFIKLDTLTENAAFLEELIELIGKKQETQIELNVLLELLQELLSHIPLHSLTLKFAESCLKHISEPQDFNSILIPASVQVAYALKKPAQAASLIRLCLKLDPNNLEVLRHLTSFYQDSGQYDQGIQIARLCYSLSEELADKIFANYLLLRGLLGTGGYWEEAVSAFQNQISLVSLLLKNKPFTLDRLTTSRLLLSNFFYPYFADNPAYSRYLQNQVAALGQANLRMSATKQIERYQHSRTHHSNQPLKVGYISYCLATHSVGWLARWLFQHHDRSQFKLYGYFPCYRPNNDPLQMWYVDQVDQAYRGDVDGPNNALCIAEKIYQDEIDILIDLDSVTLDLTSEVMALKAAPVQATWLGWDASGLPGVDYFIADPYVLPDSAQEYYSEKIWRLPQTYIAVDGFEIAVPTLRREHLGISNDAVIYLSAQRGYKRHRDTVRLQMKILREVPNSYFLIKGLGDQDAVKNFFLEIAEEEGVSCDRLRFLPGVTSEAIHRANLGIADVVLDTYPYNGATTTLETLWMGIPIVTRVGEQFAARNSYTMMVNAGITEGIAWSDEEYVEWGVRLGTDIQLRQQVSWKLRQSRQTSPLWNAKQFTQQMENAYQKMWQEYINKSA